MNNLKTIAAIVFLTYLLTAMFACETAEAQKENIYYVDSVNDNPKAYSTDQDGLVTLREAFMAATTDQPFGDAQAGTAVDQIDLSRLGPKQSTIFLNAPLVTDLQSGGSIAIRGTVGGSRNPVIDGRGKNQIFDLRGLTNLNLGWVDLANGSAEEGGAIRTGTSGTVSFSHGEITNSVARRGGAVFVRGTSGFRGNMASFIDNTALDRGGAIYIEGSGESKCKLVTMARNISVNSGGAMFIQRTKYTSPYVQIRNSTISRNMAVGSAKNRFPGSGGIAEGGPPAPYHPYLVPFELYSSIVADNYARWNSNMLQDDLRAVVDYASSHYNLVGVAGPDIGIENDVRNQIGFWARPIDAKLSSLGLHGGLLSRNFVPNADSPAIDRGSSPLPPGAQAGPYDQRGFIRVGRSDIGSIERDYEMP